MTFSKLTLITSLVLLTGCSSISKIVETKPTIVERPKLVVEIPDPAKQLAVEWIVITKDNFDEIVSKMEKKGDRVVFFALTPQGYQNLSISVAELRRYIQQQNAVVKTMREYYEAPVNEQ
jgi:hypothetical protein